MVVPWSWVVVVLAVVMVTAVVVVVVAAVWRRLMTLGVDNRSMQTSSLDIGGSGARPTPV